MKHRRVLYLLLLECLLCNSFIYGNNIVDVKMDNQSASNSCPDGLDSVQQIFMTIGCDRDITVDWPGHTTKCYSLRVLTTGGNTPIKLDNVNNSVSFNSDFVGTGDTVLLQEICSDAHAGCSNLSGTVSIEEFRVLIPNINIPGIYNLENSNTSSNTKNFAEAYTNNSPINVPITLSNLRERVGVLVRPSNSTATDASYTIVANFNIGEVDSILLKSTNLMSGDFIAIDLKTVSSFTFLVDDPNIGPGVYVDTLIYFEGNCQLTRTIRINIQRGSDIPSLVCNGQLNFYIKTTEIEITPDMILAGQQDTANKVVSISGQADNFVGCADVGNVFEVFVTDTTNGQRCWSDVFVLDASTFSVVGSDTAILCNTRIDSLSAEDMLTFYDNCTEFNNVSVSYIDNIIDQQCNNGDTLLQIFRTWIVENRAGVIQNATSVISILRSEISDVILPTKDTTILCNDSILINDGFVNFVYDIDSLAAFCKIVVGYNDRELGGSCSGNNKIERIWTAIDWCDVSIINRDTQYINIIDTFPPEIECPADQKISANGNANNANHIISEINAVDLCNTNDTVIITVQIDNLIDVFSVGDTVNLELGDHRVRYTVSDDCGNDTLCTQIVTIEDVNGPIIIGISSVQVSLQNLINTQVPVSQLVQGLTISDPSTVSRLQVRRLDNSCSNPTDTIFSDAISFCCEDADTIVQVEILAVDSVGNENTFVLDVDVKDGIAPVLVCNTDTITVFLNQDSIFAITDDSLLFFFASDNCPEYVEFDLSLDTLTFTHVNDTIDITVSAIDVDSNVTSCISTIIVDTMGLNRSAVRGLILDPFHDGLSNINVQLFDGAGSIGESNSDVHGRFSFNIDSNENFELKLNGFDDKNRGITSVDLILLQRHILGIDRITNSYLQLAADVDQSGHISATDMVRLTKIILNSENNSYEEWRFVDRNNRNQNGIISNDTLADANEAMSLTIENPIYSAIKIGDVNGDTYTNSTGRSNKSIDVIFERIDQPSKSNGELFDLYIYADEGISTFDFSIKSDHITFISFEPSLSINFDIAQYIKDDHFSIVGYHESNQLQGYVHIGRLAASTQSSISTLVKKAVVNSNAYNADLERLDINIGCLIKDAENQIITTNIHPNPVSSSFIIEHTIEDVSRIEIVDILGNLIVELPLIENGYIMVPDHVIQKSGVYFAKFYRNNELIVSKKFIVQK